MMTPKSKKIDSANGIEFEDKDIKYVILDSGTYKINDEIISVNSYGKKEVAVKDFSDIRLVTNNTYIEQYTDGINFKKYEDYDTEKELLLKKRKLEWEDEEDCNYIWNTLEDEFAYKKFLQTWQPIKKTVQVLSDPIKVEIKKVKYDTGNKFINNYFLGGYGNDVSLFIYNRPEAVKFIILECFTELGMVFQEGINYNATEGKKVWSNSKHSGIRYVVAFGTYIFDDNWKVENSPKGTLEDLLNKYEKDREALRNIITAKYNKHFGSIDLDGIDFKLILEKLNNSLYKLGKVDPKKGSYDSQRYGLKDLKDVIGMIESSFKSK